MHNLIPDRLWLGHALDVRNPTPIYDIGIKAIVDLAYEEPVPSLPRDLIYCRFPLNDGDGNCPKLLRQAIQTTVQFLRSETPTIVACSAGMSRSPCIAAAALSVVEDAAPDEILTRIGEQKPLDMSPALLKSVLAVLDTIR